MANAAVGSRISLISKSEIRYEGFLDHIDTQQNHVGLKNVRMFGTEGRKGGSGEVPASDNLYEFIIFRGGDIKDLSVFENQPRDPAIVNSKAATTSSSSHQQHQHQHQHHQQNHHGGQHNKSAWSNGPPTAFANSAAGAGIPTGNNNNSYNNSRGGYNNNNYRGNNNNRGGYNNNNNYRGGGGGHHSAGGVPPRPVVHTGQDFQVASDPAKARKEVGTDFDFAKAQQDFERSKQEARDARKNAAAASVDKYEKKDFFDKLSSNTDLKGQPGDYQARRAERDHQNATDSETFGRDMVDSQNSRGFGRGRGGRGRGGNFSGGRGGNNNNNNNNNNYRGGNGGYRGGRGNN